MIMVMVVVRDVVMVMVWDIVMVMFMVMVMVIVMVWACNNVLKHYRSYCTVILSITITKTKP